MSREFTPLDMIALPPYSYTNSMGDRTQVIRDGNIPAEVLSHFPQGYTGYAAELGASDGLYLSNTHDLEQAGWQVLCIEPNKEYYDVLVTNRKLTLNCACAAACADDQSLTVYRRILEDGTKGEPISALDHLEPEFITTFCPTAVVESIYMVPVKTLDWCLEHVQFPQLDYLSLDVDGRELDILKGLDVNRWNVKVAVVENPFNDINIRRYFKDAGFKLVAATHINHVWARP